MLLCKYHQDSNNFGETAIIKLILTLPAQSNWSSMYLRLAFTRSDSCLNGSNLSNWKHYKKKQQDIAKANIKLKMLPNNKVLRTNSRFPQRNSSRLRPIQKLTFFNPSDLPSHFRVSELNSRTAFSKVISLLNSLDYLSV